MAYTKSWKSYAEQLELLISRGLAVTDRSKALKYLQSIGYYRLSGYWYPFRKRSDRTLNDGGRKSAGQRKAATTVLEDFKAGATFEKVIELYVFDRRLRLLALDALERIEIALRVDISHTLGKIDPFAYLNPHLLHQGFSRTYHQEWRNKHERLIDRAKEEFVLHYKEKYGLPLPIWVACEVWDFGTMSHLYGGMREQDQDAISAKYGIRNGRILATWLRSLNHLRNICAHHSRLWNRNIADQPKLPPASEVVWVAPFENDNRLRARCFLLLCITRHLLQIVNPTSSWPQRMKTHLQNFPALDYLMVDLSKGMRVPDGWENEW